MALAGCASAPPAPVSGPLPASVWAVTATNELIKLNANAPARVLERKQLKGLAAGETLVGIDYRVARGVLYGLSDKGRLVTINTGTGELTAVGTPVAGLQGGAFGFDFNPAVDRIRVVSASGQNLRLHPDTGALIDFDPAIEGVQQDGRLSFAQGDLNFGKQPEVAAAAYTYNKTNDKLTTMFVIDRTFGALMMQGSQEDVTPPVSPNLGRLTTIGGLGVGALLDAAFDISDVGNIGLAALRFSGPNATRLYRINLKSGQATEIGKLGTGESVTGMAIEP